MLSVLMDNHPDIYISSSTLFRKLFDWKKYKLLKSNREGLEKYLKDQNSVIGNERYKEFGDIITNENIPFRKALTNFYGAVANKNSKKAVGDKVPGLVNQIHELLFFMPTAKIIHIVRDPRPVCLSHFKRSRKNITSCIKEWRTGNMTALYYQDVLGKDKFHIVKYEDLVNNPVTTMRQVMAFLGLDFDQGIVNLQSHNDTKSPNSYVKNFFDQSKLDDWKNSLDNKQVLLIEKHLKDLMEHFNYPLRNSNVEFKKLRNKSLFFADLQSNFQYLINGKQQGMKDRKVIYIKVSVGRRVKVFLKNTISDIFNTEFLRIFK